MQPFEETEIWYMLYRICEIAAKVHEKNIIIGDIRPKNIFLFPEGEIALNCKATFIDE
jgi:serine/threonine protein kinase